MGVSTSKTFLTALSSLEDSYEKIDSFENLNTNDKLLSTNKQLSTIVIPTAGKVRQGIPPFAERLETAVSDIRKHLNRIIDDILPQIQQDTLLQNKPIYSVQLQNLDVNLARINKDLSTRIEQIRRKSSDESLDKAIEGAENFNSSITECREAIAIFAQKVNQQLKEQVSSIEPQAQLPDKNHTSSRRERRN